jgi:uncharacterized membrane protein YgdD (TMEM256/DUF423 family)
MHQRFPLLSAGLVGATGVVFGAVGTHALGPALAARGMRDAWETGVDFQMFHALALLGLAGWMRPLPTGAAAVRATRAVHAWVAGTVLFSGSLYALALGAPRWVGPFTPLGGLCLIGGWVFAAAAAVAPRSEFDI